MPNLMIDLTVDRVDLVDEGANSAAHICLFKSKGGKNSMTYEEILAKMKPEHREVVEAELDKAKCEVPEEAQKKIEQADELQKQLDEANEKLENTEDELNKAKEELEAQEVAKSKGEPEFEDVLKGLDPSVQEVFKSMQAAKEAAEAEVAKAKEAKQHEEAVAKAKELKGLPTEEEKLVEAIKKGIEPEVLAILKAASTALEESGLFKSQGSDAKEDKEATGDDAWAVIETKAEAVAKSKGMSMAKAIDTVLKENPDLYNRYIQGGR